MDGLIESSATLADAFRFGAALPSGRKLRALTEAADTLVVTATRLSRELGTTLADLAATNPEISEAIGDLADAIDQLDMYEQDGDWTAVADTLEQEVTAALTAWRGVFATLAGIAACATNGACVA